MSEVYSPVTAAKSGTRSGTAPPGFCYSAPAVSEHKNPDQVQLAAGLQVTVKGNFCVFCGESAGMTRDHIPPRGIFPKPRPHLITVPACLSCNRSTAKIEELFRVYLSLRIGMSTSATARLWKKEAIRTLRHNLKLANRLVSSTKSISVRTPAGIILAERPGLRWPAEYHDPIIEKMIRGFYFYHYHEILGQRVNINVQWLHTLEDLENQSRRIDPSLEALWIELPGAGKIGTGYFRYRYAKAIESPLHSTWLFDFYGAHFASGYTWPVDGPEEPE